MDSRSPSAGMLIALQDDDTRPFSHNETVAFTVVRARGPLRGIIERSGQRPTGNETCHPNAGYRRLGTARHHDVGIAQCDKSRSIANRMCAGGASGNYRMIWAFKTMR